MRLLFCCEFYFPSVGGVQEVMRQIAERLVRRGHDVTVATTRLANRDFSEHNGVKIVEFGVTGNLVRGMEGELDRYREFVASFDCDAIMIKAAQQWTFDALWSILDRISTRKVLIPCGFSGLYEPTYTEYFEDLPDILRKFNHLIFYAENYRDVDYAREYHIEQFSILANGASEIEFGVAKDPEFRRTHGIPEDSTILLTVGSLTGVKGHRELLEAFVRLKTSRRHVTFIMNGNPPPRPMVHTAQSASQSSTVTGSTPGFLLRLKRIYAVEGVEGLKKRVTARCAQGRAGGFLLRLKRIYAVEGVEGLKKRVTARCAQGRAGGFLLRLKRIYAVEGVGGLKKRVTARCAQGRAGLSWVVRLASTLRRVWVEEGWLGIRLRLIQGLVARLARMGLHRLIPASVRALANPMEFWMAEARRDPARKRLIVSDYPRDELVQAYMAADLFVFASNIEYSPLVLFESVAAGTPFLSVPVGNAEEIARWTGGGIICPADKDERGYTRAAPAVLAREIAKAIENPERLLALGQAGHAAWRERYTWDEIATRYEAILRGVAVPVAQGKTACTPV